MADKLIKDLDATSSIALTDLIVVADPTSGIAEKAAVSVLDVAHVLAKGSVTSAATVSIDFSSYYTAYDILYVHIYGSRPATDATTLQMRLSADGSAYDSGSTDYTDGYQYASSGASSGSWSAGNSAGLLSLNVLCGNAAHEHADMVFKITCPNNAAFYPIVACEVIYLNTTSQSTIMHCHVARQAAQVCRGLQIFYSTGNVAEAKYKVIGYKN